MLKEYMTPEELARLDALYDKDDGYHRHYTTDYGQYYRRYYASKYKPLTAQSTEEMTANLTKLYAKFARVYNKLPNEVH